MSAMWCQCVAVHGTAWLMGALGNADWCKVSAGTSAVYALETLPVTGQIRWIEVKNNLTYLTQVA